MKPRYSLLGQEDLDLTDTGSGGDSGSGGGIDVLSDVFSSFSRHLAPGPGHERPERYNL